MYVFVIKPWLARRGGTLHPPGVFLVSEAVATTIRTILAQDGELSAAIELRRLFPGITDTAMARAHVRTIAGWQPLPLSPMPGKKQRGGGAGQDRR